MTDQRELDRLLGAYFVEGTNELADRVIDAALDQIDQTEQRRPVRVPRRFPTMTMPLRLAAAAVIGVLAVGGALLFIGPGRPSIGGPAASPPARPTGSAAVSSRWTVIDAPAEDHGSGAVTIPLQDGRVLIAGGARAGGGVSNTAEVYDPGTRTWSATGSMTVGRSSPVAERLADGRVLVAGGSSDVADLDSAEIYDPATAVWTATGSMSEVRGQVFGALLADGRVLVGGSSMNRLLKSAEVYDPSSGKWTDTGNMTTFRDGPLGATLLFDGRVLVTGGFTPDVTSAEFYDPTTGTWAATANMHAERENAQSTVRMADGKVLVGGGNSGAPTELFDPATETWTIAGSMVEQYTGRVALVPLADGNVLLVGGGGSRGANVATGQIYHPATGAWSPIDDMAQGRFVRSASVLPDGTVLVVTSTTNQLNVTGEPGAELYDPTP